MPQLIKIWHIIAIGKPPHNVEFGTLNSTKRSSLVESSPAVFHCIDLGNLKVEHEVVSSRALEKAVGGAMLKLKRVFNDYSCLYYTVIFLSRPPPKKTSKNLMPLNHAFIALLAIHFAHASFFILG